MKQPAPRHVWITGASSGLGEALAREYSGAGARVALTARSKDTLERCRTNLPRPRDAGVYPADVTRPDEISRAVREIDKHAPIDLAILNAGTYAPMTLDDWNTDAIRKLFEVNFFGVTACIDNLLPRLRARGAGTIAVVASVAGDIGLPYAAPYSASKSALNRICESLRPELEREGVAVSVVNPGFVRTPLTARNEFPMPFLIDADRAAAIIRRGLAAGHREIRFPWQMSLLMRIIANLPSPLAAPVLRKMLRS